MKTRNAWLSLWLALAIALGLCACSGKGDEGSGGGEGEGPPSPIAIGGPSRLLGGGFTEEIKAALGEPASVEQAPSCHYDGTDNIYTYADFSVYTYMQGDKSVMYSIEVRSDAYPTPEGAKVGMTLDEVKAACGEGAEGLDAGNGVYYSLGGGMQLKFFHTDDNRVQRIEYYVE